MASRCSRVSALCKFRTTLAKEELGKTRTTTEIARSASEHSGLCRAKPAPPLRGERPLSFCLDHDFCPNCRLTGRELITGKQCRLRRFRKVIVRRKRQGVPDLRLMATITPAIPYPGMISRANCSPVYARRGPPGRRPPRRCAGARSVLDLGRDPAAIVRGRHRSSVASWSPSSGCAHAPIQGDAVQGQIGVLVLSAIQQTPPGRRRESTASFLQCCGRESQDASSCTA